MEVKKLLSAPTASLRPILPIVVFDATAAPRPLPVFFDQAKGDPGAYVIVPSR